MTARLDISLFSALCLLLAVTFCSCSQVHDEEGLGEQEQKTGNRISLKFKIYTESDPTTRTRGLGEWEEASANVAERILNPNDVRVLLLNNAPEPQLVKSFKPDRLDYVEDKTQEGVVTGDGYYELSVYFEDATIDGMADDEEFTFSVIIFANINSLDGGYDTDNMRKGTARSKLQELFTMDRYWFPSESNGIPMYGYKSGIKVTKAQLQDENYNMGDITMLRALSKIEVYDNVEGVVINGRKYPYIEKVELISWRDKGYLRPLYDGYEVQGSLKTANIPTSSTVITNSRVDAHKMEDGVDINGDRIIDPCFRIYCPEAKLKDVAIHLTVTLAPDIYKDYEVSLGQYADGNKANPVFGNDLVRNHIYRFKVNSFSVPAELAVEVSEWGKQVDEYTLDDIISMDDNGYLKWNIAGNSYFSDDPNATYNGKPAKQLSILGGTPDYATGTFTISSPQGATWRAFFIPGENGVDAFEFVDVNAAGEVTATHSFVEGAVGTQATIRIRGKGPADAYRHTAELVVEVRQPDGTVLYAPIAAPEINSYIIYRENKL